MTTATEHRRRPTTGAGSTRRPGSDLPRTGTAIEARGVVVCIGLDEAGAAATGTDLEVLAEALERRISELVPQAEVFAGLALAPSGVGRPLDAVRSTLPDLLARLGAARAVDHREIAALRERRDDGHRVMVPDQTSEATHGLVLDMGRRQVWADGAVVRLTFVEIELLRALAEARGRVLTREELLASVPSAGPERSVRAVDVHVLRLRRKLGGYGGVIATVRGVGYRVDERSDVQVRTRRTG